ncbi:MAG: nucleotidyltransferase domain-containing protein [Candidatus Thorarchaeota archaeon]|nr:nucleotidyltransferase domain-containing protein [Candidatus Thorarchaeota archaeon]
MKLLIFIEGRVPEQFRSIYSTYLQAGLVLGEKDWPSKLRDIHVPPYMITQLESMIAGILDTCSAMVLTGSWATGQEHPESDLDILLCVEDDEAKSAVRSMLRRRKPEMKNDRRSIDIKVIDLSKEIHSQNLAERLCISIQLAHCICLWGKMPSMVPKFSTNDAIQLFGIITDELNGGFAWLENRTRYSQAVVQITNSLKSLFYMTSFLPADSNQFGTKIQFLERCLGKSYSDVIQTYNRIQANHFDNDAAKVNVAEERKKGIQQYSLLLERENEITSTLKQFRKLLEV